MSIIIDGYNLLHGAGIVVESGGPYSLEKSRAALIKFLAANLDKDELAKTTVVFDAKHAAPNLPRGYTAAGISVLFADRKEDADAMIARLVQQHSAPRQLTVVSSDHAVQRSARRRRAKFVDSHVWFAARVRQKRVLDETHASSRQAEKPFAPLAPEEIADWVATFAEDDRDRLTSSDDPDRTTKPGDQPTSERHDHPENELPENYNPFPEGYGEDLLGGS